MSPRLRDLLVAVGGIIPLALLSYWLPLWKYFEIGAGHKHAYLAALLAAPLLVLFMFAFLRTQQDIPKEWAGRAIVGGIGCSVASAWLVLLVMPSLVPMLGLELEPHAYWLHLAVMAGESGESFSLARMAALMAYLLFVALAPGIANGLVYGAGSALLYTGLRAREAKLAPPATTP